MDFYDKISENSFWIIFLLIFSRYLVVAAIAFLIFYVIRKNGWFYKRIQLRFPRNQDYYRELFFSILTAVVFAAIGYLLFFTAVRKHTLLYLSIDEYGLLYFFGSIFITLVIHDTYFYWTHRAMHHPIVYRWFHKVHHLSTNPSPWAAYAFHPLEAIVEAGIVVLVAFIMPLHPFAIGLFLLIMIIYNVYGHLGYELYPAGFSKSKWGKWINTSVNHNLHHQFFKGNYGLYFLWWDRWMGTLRPDYDQRFDEVKAQEAPDGK